MAGSDVADVADVAACCAIGGAGRFESDDVDGVPGREALANDAEVGEGRPSVKGDGFLEADDKGLSFRGREVLVEEGLADPV